MDIGRVVFSKAGRDKNRAFIVVSAGGEYLFLADGNLHLLEKPKKKKMRHIQPTNTVIEDIRYKLENDKYISNADLRKALLPFSPRDAQEAKL